MSLPGEQTVTLPVGAADPHETYDRLRESGPVHRLSTPEGNPIWLVTRYPDVRAALGDPRLSLSKANAAGEGYRGFSLPPALDANLLNLDPPDHSRLRRLVGKAFTARRVEDLRGRVQATTDTLLDALAERGGGDLIAEFAEPLPLTVIGDLLGVPEDRRRDFQHWTGILLAPEPHQRAQAPQAVAALHQFMVDLVAEKRRQPGDDLLSALITVRDAGDRLVEDELVSLAFLIFWAGHETTIHVIGNGMLALLRHPDQLRALRERPELLPGAVEELLRYAHPNLLSIRRFPTEDIEIAGTAIPAGATVMLGLASADRDPDQFADPARLDVTRDPNPHLALGQGIHYCLGAPLARLEVQIAVGTLLDRFPGLALAVGEDDLWYRPSWRHHSLRALPMRV
jgi:cytochrome P450